ncbi:MAG: rhodanese-like domain-containing protein [Myxococcota bacterium]
MKKFELAIYVAALAVLGALLMAEGRTTTELEARAAVSPKELWALLSNPQLKLQIVDLRPYDDDHYLDTHIPGSIPLPSCDLEKAPPAARDRIYPYVTTIIVTEDGDRAAFEQCRAKFGVARNLAGGLTAWTDENKPEDTGEYSPPKAGAGGGCL